MQDPLWLSHPWPGERCAWGTPENQYNLDLDISQLQLSQVKLLKW